MRRTFALVWALATAVVGVVVGIFSYQAGWAAGLATKLPEGAAVAAPYYVYGPHFFGFGWLVPLLLFVLLLAFIFRGRRRWAGYGGTPPAIEERLQEWHRRAHGEQPAPPGDRTV